MNPYHQLGINIACAFAGITPAEFEFCKAASETVEAPGNAEVYGRYMSRMAAGLYKEAGKMDTLEHFLYEELSKSAAWHQEFNAFIEPVEMALGRQYQANIKAEQESETTKAANAGALNAYIGGEILGHGLSLTPAAAKALAALGVGIGGASGVMWHYLNRDANEDDDKLEAVKAKINQYDHITRDISHDLARKGLLENPV